MTIATQLTMCESLKQQHAQQMDTMLQRLEEQMTQQLKQLQEQEQVMLEAQTLALASLRLALATDVRCLLPTPQFRHFVERLTVDLTLLLFRSSRTLLVTTEPTTWLLATQPLPLVLLHYEAVCDHSAYNDENYYTDYRYQLTAQLGQWQKTVGVSTASLHPGNPMSYHLKSLRSQHYDMAYCLLEADRYLPEPLSQPEFLPLTLDESQVVQLKQEISCLLAFVGDLLHQHSHVERFRYPHQRCDH